MRLTLPQNAGLLLASYLAGAFPTADLVAKALGRDIHHEGSGNPGATNTYRIAGARAAAVVVAVDMAKGAVTTIAGRRLAVTTIAGRRLAPGLQRSAGRTGRTSLAPACGVAAVLGHCFPPTKPTEGGKGVATTGGMLVVLDPTLALGSAAAWATLAQASRRPSLASVAVAVALPLAATALHRDRAERLALAAVSAIIVIRHRENIGRLRRGEEQAVGGY